MCLIFSKKKNSRGAEQSASKFGIRRKILQFFVNYDGRAPRRGLEMFIFNLTLLCV